MNHPTKNSIRSVLMLILIAFSVSCNAQNSSKQLSGSDKLEDRLKMAIDEINKGTYGTIHSLLVVKDDEIVSEHYFNGWERDSLHMMQSTTKSFLSTLMGIAIQQGFIKDVNQKVLPFFKKKNIQSVDSFKNQLTIEDLLTQRHGLKWRESPWNSPKNNWRKLLATEGDWYEKILSNPMEVKPGTVFNYSNGAPVLISGIIQEASGMKIEAFAQKYFFDVLYIKKYRFWQGNGGPSNNGSALLFLTSRDMAKIGQLYLNNGSWNGQQLLPEGWVEQAAKTSFTKNIKDNKFYRFGYGYFWWNSPIALGSNPKPNPNIYLARGAGGQYIIVDPIERVVVVITAWDLRKANFIFDIYSKYLQPVKYQKKILEPQPILEDILSDKVEMSLTYMPDGKELYFVKRDSFYANNQKSTIHFSRLKDGVWSLPKVAPFSGQHSDASPFVTPDGNRIYFSSDRPILAGNEKKDRDIWYVERNGNSWSQPIHLSIYNSEESEYSPTLDRENNLYFGSYRDGGLGSGDLWISKFKNGKYQKPINLGASINTSGGEWGSCIAPNGEYIIFEASGREENITYDGDLFISYKKSGIWTKAEHLGQLNSGGSDLSPKIHNNTLYFSSNRHSDPVIEMNNNNVDVYKIEITKILKKQF